MNGALSSAGGRHGLISVSTPNWMRSSKLKSPVVEKQLGLPSQPRSPLNVISSKESSPRTVRFAIPRSFGGVPGRFGLSR